MQLWLSAHLKSMGKEVDKLLASLRQDNALKVWSLIITFFGDAVVTRGGNVSAKTVQAVLAGMEVGNGAVRTALSRLVNDQWIVRQKIGRESFYELADEGYRPFQAASVRIYSACSGEESATNIWTLAVNDARSKADVTDLPDGAVQISSNCWLIKDLQSCVANSLEDKAFILFSGELGRFPVWLKNKFISDKKIDEYQTLQQQFAGIERVTSLTPLDSLIVRCLLIHQWRRLLLRSAALPQELLAPEHECRQFVSALYERLLPNSELWLDQNATCANGKIPEAAAGIKHRFTEAYV